jgi:hypothetical protein
MARRTIVSALFVVGLFAVAAAGQQPKFTVTDPKSKEKKADPADAAVAAALANDPDVLVARAKVQLAEAELAKARQAVVLKVMTLNAAIQEQKSALAATEDRLAWTARMVEKGVTDQRQLVEDRAKLESAKAALTRSQMELKLLTGSGKEHGVEMTPSVGFDRAVASGLHFLSARAGEESQQATALALLAGLDAYRAAHAIKGPIPETIRAALDKRVKLGRKDFQMLVTFEEALAIFKKEAGLDVPVRVMIKDVSSILPEGEELPVGAWFQLFADGNPDARFLVREYGLLVAPKATAPPDAVSVIDFWKQKPAAAKKETSPEPKPGK